MVIKFVESSLSSFKDKLKNPFFGTLLIVWIIRNREFLFNLFFNKDYNSDERLNLLINQFNDIKALWNFLLTILISLIIMIVVYVALNLSRFIVEFSERILKPQILKLFSKSSIVSIDEFKRVEEQRDYYQKRYTQERDEKLKIQREVESNIKIPKISNSIDENHEVVSSQLEYLKNNNLMKDFSTIIDIVNDKSKAVNISNSEINKSIIKFLKKNIIEKYNEGSAMRFKFTDLGQTLRDLFLKEYHE